MYSDIMIILILTFFHHFVYYICNLDYVQYLYSCMYFIERYENKLKLKLKIEIEIENRIEIELQQ